MENSNFNIKTVGDLSKGRINNITFLRLLAAISVIIGHSHAIVFNGGQDIVTKITGYAHIGGVAVDFFFLLSGFLVTSSLVKNGIIHYLVSRSFRLIPALWVYLLITVLIIGPILTKLEIKEYFLDKQTWKYLINIGSAYQAEYFLPSVFNENNNKAVNGSIWSIVIEIRVYFYLLIFYIFGIFKNRYLFNSIAAIFVVLVWSGVISIFGITGKTDLHVAFLFLIGSFIYVNKDFIYISPIYMLVALAIAAITHGTENFQYSYILVITGIFCSITFMKNFSWLDKYGDYSYGIYLWGWPVQQICAQIFPKSSYLINIILSIPITILFAIISWHYIEEPALMLKNKFIKKIKNGK